MDIVILGIIASIVGAAFCFCMAGAVKNERHPEDIAH